MKYAFIIFISSFLFGCATTQKYEAILDSWSGSAETDLVSSWGAPANEYTAKDGSRILTYIQSGGTRGTAYYNPYTKMVYNNDQEVYCKTHFVVSSVGIVTSWRYEGNMCRAN